MCVMLLLQASCTTICSCTLCSAQPRRQPLYVTAKQTLVEETPKNATNPLKQPWAPKSLAAFQRVHSCRRKPLEPVYSLVYPSLHHLRKACNPCTQLILCIYATSCPTATELITARNLNSYISLKPTFVQTLCFLSGYPLKRKKKHAPLLYTFHQFIQYFSNVSQ